MEFVGACASSDEAFTGGGGEPKKQSALGRKKTNQQNKQKQKSTPSFHPGLNRLSSFAAKTKFHSVQLVSKVGVCVHILI